MLRTIPIKFIWSVCLVSLLAEYSKYLFIMSLSFWTAKELQFWELSGLIFFIFKIISCIKWFQKAFLPQNTALNTCYIREQMYPAWYQEVMGRKKEHTALYPAPMKITSIGWTWWKILFLTHRNAISWFNVILEEMRLIYIKPGITLTI